MSEDQDVKDEAEEGEEIELNPSLIEEEIDEVIGGVEKEDEDDFSDDAFASESDDFDESDEDNLGEIGFSISGESSSEEGDSLLN